MTKQKHQEFIQKVTKIAQLVQGPMRFRELSKEQEDRFVNLMNNNTVVKYKRKKSIRCFFRFLINLLKGEKNG